MPRTISVKGEGKISARPDYIAVTLNLQSKEKEYAAAMDKADRDSEAITAAVTGAGFEKEALKTTNFNVRTEYEGYHDPEGNYRQRFAGYAVTVGLTLGFDFDTARLAGVLGAIGDCGANPEIAIRFTLRDPEAVRREVLEAAAKDARSKAEILAAASGVKLGKLLNVEYNWHNAAFDSATSVTADNAMMPRMAKAAFAANMTPEDVEIVDSAGFVWEIE